MRPQVCKLPVLLLGSDQSECLTPVDQYHNVSPHSVRLANGTFVGVRDKNYAQDLFLGIPDAQPPLGSLRYAPPQPLNESFEEPRSATDLGSPVSEDCLTINIVRPAGTKPGDDLSVGLWIHGGSYVNGGSRDPRYNLSYIVDQSAKKDKPIIAASINYRLSYWGFLFSRELQNNKAGEHRI
ncbi:alpha/beta-hydrolase [Colletotrichum caudatum]|nr:alpha/beta-hydrolase [Colletotrichum caudatum]